MSEVRTIIKFDGKALDGKSMDVAHLAPALLSLSDLLKEANRMFNGDKVGIKVLVNADLEQKCFELFIDLSMTLWDSAKQMILHEDIKSIKEIAEWVGIFGGIGGTTGLYLLMKKLKGKKIESVESLKTKEGKDEIRLTVKGDSNTINVDKNVYNLYTNPEIRQKSIDLLAPLREDGYDSLSFYKDKKVFIKFSKDEIPEKNGDDLPAVKEVAENISSIKTNVRIKKAVYEGNAKWTLVYRNTIQASIDDKDWLESFQTGETEAPPRSSLKVELEESYRANDDGEMLGEAAYRVVKVYEVNLPIETTPLRFYDEK